MPDGTIPSTAEALRTALSAARHSLERQQADGNPDAAGDALRHVSAALDLLASRADAITDIEWTDSPLTPAPIAPAAELSAVCDDTADDLTMIRGIDAPLARRLAAIGIRRFAQIAAWQPEDVRTIADAMGLGRRFLAAGIVDQAAEHVRRASRSRTAPPPDRSQIEPANRQAIAVWQPQTGTPASLVVACTPIAPSWQPLEAETLRLAAAAIRKRLPQGRIVSLAQLVPPLAQPVFVASDKADEPELPRWRTGVLVPFVDPTATSLSALRPPADSRTALPHQAAPPQHAHPAPPASDTTLIPRSSPTDPASQAPPVHVRVAAQLTHLEATLDTMAQALSVSAPGSHPHAAPLAPPPLAPRMAHPPLDAASPPSSIHPDREEAEVTIRTRQPRLKPRPLLEPLPEPPLTPPNSPVASAPPAQWPNLQHVPEAAVIIVRRGGAPQPISPSTSDATKRGVGRVLRWLTRRSPASEARPLNAAPSLPD